MVCLHQKRNCTDFCGAFGCNVVYAQEKIQKFNKEIAKEFEAEGKQNVILGEDVLQLNEKTVSYSEIATLYEFKHSFSLIYQGNHVYIIPKNVLEEGQAEQFAGLMKEKIGDKYQNISKK